LPAAVLAAEPGRDAVAAVRHVRGLVTTGDGTAALAAAARLRRDNPGAPDAHMLVGDVLAAGGRWAEAAGAFAAAADIAFSESAALRLADAQRRAGAPQAASLTLGLFLAQNPRSIPALNANGALLLAAGRWDAAIALFEGLRRRIGDGDAAILNNLAWAWAGKGDPARAAAFARAAHAAGPANPALADTLGWLLFEGGDRRYGLALIEQAVAMAPADPGLRWHLAQAYAALGRAHEARVAAEAVAANRDFPLRADALALARAP
uniref:tetratricopeptide repeat protein n=1 Tax=Sphingomonas flavalba TaxID=2559804 RepID=UPI00109DF643